MSGHINREVLETVAENITGADGVIAYAPARVVETPWASLLGRWTCLAVLIAYPEDDLEAARGGAFTVAFQACLVARVIAETARTVVANLDSHDKFDAEDALEDFYMEMTQVRTDGHPDGLLVVFTGLKVKDAES